MDRKIKYLAQCRKVEAEYKTQVAETEAELRKSTLWDCLEQERKYLATAKADAKDAEADVRKAALEAYIMTDDPRPHSAVQIKMYTVLEYNLGDAMGYAREHLPQALKLDVRTFEKAAKAIELDFVRAVKQPRATIARDLSEWETSE